jgi:hypothetical protein
MKKLKQFYPVNNQEDEDSSSYPLYPHTEENYRKEKKIKGASRENNAEIPSLASKSSDGMINSSIQIQ